MKSLKLLGLLFGVLFLGACNSNEPQTPATTSENYAKDSVKQTNTTISNKEEVLCAFAASRSPIVMVSDVSIDYSVETIRDFVHRIMTWLPFEDIIEIEKRDSCANALAVRKQGKKYIYYNPAYFSFARLRSNESAGAPADLSALIMLAHEVGHHLHNDSLSRIDNEKAADYVAGWILYKFGYQKEAIKKTLHSFLIDDPNYPTQTRIERIMRGWDLAQGQYDKNKISSDTLCIKYRDLQKCRECQEKYETICTQAKAKSLDKSRLSFADTCRRAQLFQALIGLWEQKRSGNCENQVELDNNLREVLTGLNRRNIPQKKDNCWVMKNHSLWDSCKAAKLEKDAYLFLLNGDIRQARTYLGNAYVTYPWIGVVDEIYRTKNVLTESRVIQFEKGQLSHKELLKEVKTWLDKDSNRNQTIRMEIAQMLQN